MGKILIVEMPPPTSSLCLKFRLDALMSALSDEKCKYEVMMSNTLSGIACNSKLELLLELWLFLELSDAIFAEMHARNPVHA